MKKFFFFMVAAVAMLAVSCSKEDSSVSKGDNFVTFKVTAPELATRAIGDGTTAQTLHYAVYDAEWNHIAALDGTTSINITADVKMELLDGKVYNFIFWAQNADAPYTFDAAGKKMTVNYTDIKANNEKLDAFYAKVENMKVQSGITKTVELFRPFAQLNVATLDWDTMAKSGETFDKTEVKVKAYNTLDFVSGAVSGEEVRTFNYEVMPNETLSVNGKSYKWMAMNYLLVNEKELVKVTFNANNTDVAEKVWDNVPVERNHRTHILGNLLTSSVDFEVIIRPAFEEEPGYIYDVWDGTEKAVTPTAEGVYEIKTGSELAWFASEVTASPATFNNKTVKLMADLDMSQHEWTPIKTWGSGNFTFDGNGHEITGLNIDAEGDSIGFIGANSASWTISNLTFIDPQISATEKFIGTVIGYQYGHVVLNNVDVKGGYIEGRNHLSIRIGGLIGFSVTHDGATLALTDCDVDGITIRGYHNLAGLVGTVIEPDATMDNCTSTNNKFILTNPKQTTATESAWWPFDANAYNEGASIKTNCTHSGNTAEYVGRSVATVEELVNAVKGAAKGEIINIAEGTYPVVLDVVGQKDITLKANGEVILAGLDHQTNGVPSTVKVEGITFDNSIVTTRAEGGWFTGTAQNIAPCVGAWGGHFTFDDCKFVVAGTSGRETGIMTWWTVDLVTFKFNNCVFEGKENHASARAMQIYGKVDMEVNNCTFTTAKDYSLKYVGGEGNVAVFEGNKVYNSENFVELGSSVYPGNKYTVKINNTTLGDGVNHYVIANAEKQTVLIDGECVSYPDLTLVDGYTALYTDAEGVYCLMNKQSLIDWHDFLAAKPNVNPYNKVFKLLGNIDAEGYTWKSVNGMPDSTTFVGLVFDGQDYTISNLNVVGEGMLNLAPAGSVFKNVTFDKAVATSEGHNAAIIWGSVYSKVSFENVHIKNSSVTGLCNVGTFVGGSYEPNNLVVSFKDCSVEGCQITANGYGGQDPTGASGFIGKAYAATKLVFEGVNSIDEATTITNNNGLVGGRVYGYTLWQDGGFIGTGASDKFENWAGLKEIVYTDSYEEVADAPIAAGEVINFEDNVAGESANSNGYGGTGLNVFGGTIDGQGNTLSVSGANGTWDSAINITGGTIKNLTIDSGFRGIFVNHNSTECSKVYLENVIIDGPTYTISCDQGTNKGLEAVGSTFNGWTSYAATLGDVLFTNCQFGEGSGYAYCRPYAPTTFVNCDFEAGFALDARAAVKFENCTLNGVKLTSENIATLVTSNASNVIEVK